MTKTEQPQPPADLAQQLAISEQRCIVATRESHAFQQALGEVKAAAAIERERLSRELLRLQAERDSIAARLAQAYATRAWRVAGTWWRLRDRLLGRRRGPPGDPNAAPGPPELVAPTLSTVGAELWSKDAHARIAALGGPGLEWSPGAMTAKGLISVLDEIEQHERVRIVEFGAGVSTIIIARSLALRARGHLTTFEHSQDWLDLVSQHLRDEQLEQYVSLVHAPLRAKDHDAEEPAWYDLDAVEAGCSSEIDLLIVDGPPASRPEWRLRRYPALSVVLDRLTSDATVVLDDADRPGEAEIIGRWEQESAFRFERRLWCGIAVGRRVTDSDGHAPHGRPR